MGNSQDTQDVWSMSDLAQTQVLLSMSGKIEEFPAWRAVECSNPGDIDSGRLLLSFNRNWRGFMGGFMVFHTENQWNHVEVTAHIVAALFKHRCWNHPKAIQLGLFRKNIYINSHNPKVQNCCYIVTILIFVGWKFLFVSYCLMVKTHHLLCWQDLNSLDGEAPISRPSKTYILQYNPLYSIRKKQGIQGISMNIPYFFTKKERWFSWSNSL